MISESALSMLDRGYGSNPILDRILTDARSNPKLLWSLQYQGPDSLLGGAAGGGKSFSLLCQALQYVDVPGYAALLVRSQFTDLSMAGGLMDKASTFLANIPGVHKKDGGKRWEFETSDPDRPAVLQFGHLGYVGAEYNYKSSEFQFIGVDESTETPEKAVLYLKSRLRRPQCPKHRSLLRPDCRECQRIGPLSKVPLRFRLASNPGGKYGEWVKNRYVLNACTPGIDGEYLKADEETQFSRVWTVSVHCDDCNGSGRTRDYVDPTIITDCPACSGKGVTIRHFIPARLKDNKHVDPRSYIQSLKGMENPVEAARLLHGKWDVMEEGNFFKEESFRYYDWIGGGANAIARLKVPGGNPLLVNPEHFEWFVTADTASKDKTQNDPTVAIVWAVSLLTWDLLLVDMIRDWILVPQILPRIQQLIAPYPVQFVIMEEASSGIGLIQEARTTKGLGLTILPYNPHTGDKVSRATGAMIRMKNGQVYFPLVAKLPGKNVDWMSIVRSELIGFNSLEHDDIVDNFSMAEWYVGGNIRSRNSGSNLPEPLAGTGIFGGSYPGQSPFGVY